MQQNGYILCLHDAAVFGPPLITCFDSSSPAAFHRDVLKLAPSPASALWSSKNWMRHVSSSNVQILQSGPVVVTDIKICLVECRLPEVRVRIIDWYQLIKVTHVTKVWIGTIWNSSHFVKFQCHFVPGPKRLLVSCPSVLGEFWASEFQKLVNFSDANSPTIVQQAHQEKYTFLFWLYKGFMKPKKS